MSTLTPRFEELRALLADVERVVVSGHAKADGDAVGAIAAMRRHLELEPFEKLLAMHSTDIDGARRRVIASVTPRRLRWHNCPRASQNC